MQKSGAGDLRKRFNGKLHGLGHDHGKRGYALAMANGFGVLQIERSAQGLERCVIGLLELVQGFLQLTGALRDELFQIPLVMAIFQQQAAMFQRPADT